MLLARAGWAAGALVTVVTFVAAVPVRFTTLQTDPFFVDFVATGASLGLTPQSFALYITGLEVAFGLAYLVFAVLVVWRKSDDWMVLLYTFTLMLSAVFLSDLATSLRIAQPDWAPPLIFFRALNYSLILTFYVIFPDGQFFPRWTRYLAAIWAIFTLSWLLDPNLIPPTNHASIRTPREILLLLWLLAWMATGAASQILRFIRVKDPIARQQTKWVVTGLAVLALAMVATFGAGLLFPSLRTPGAANVRYVLIAVPVTFLGSAAVPAAIGLSILRYRLWDIDALVNRALVYGGLTGALALVFSGSVILLQRPVQLLTGQGRSPFATVLSTLLVAALFSPLRNRLQEIIDRKFYRRRYNAQRAMSAFSARVRDEVDLDSLSAALLDIVDQTVRPESAALWLKESDD